MNFFDILEQAMLVKIKDEVNKALAEAADGRRLDRLAERLRELTEDYDRRLTSIENGDGFDDAFQDFLSRDATERESFRVKTPTIPRR